MMRRFFRLARPDRTDERGFSLVELMVATALLSLVTVAAFGTVIAMQHQAVLTTDRFTAEGEAQTIADRITKDLRTAVAPSSTEAAFASAGPSDITFYASLSDPNGPTKLHAYVSLVPGTNVDVFHEDATPPDPGGTPGNYAYTQSSPVTRLDGRYLDTSQAIFTYFDANGDPIGADRLATLEGRRSIDSVGLNLRVRVQPSSPIVVINSLIHARVPRAGGNVLLQSAVGSVGLRQELQLRHAPQVPEPSVFPFARTISVGPNLLHRAETDVDPVIIGRSRPSAR